MITWDFEIRWRRNFSPFFWRKQGFLMVLRRFIVHRCQRHGTKKKTTQKIHPLRIKQDKKRTEGPEEGRWGTNCFKHLVWPTARQSGSPLLWKERGVENPSVGGGGATYTIPKILEAAVQSAGLCSLFPANYNVIGAWANRALGAPLKLSDGPGLQEQHRCRSSSGTQTTSANTW